MLDIGNGSKEECHNAPQQLSCRKIP
jgi:hypothetical protein